MKIVIQIYKTNPDGSNSLYTMSQGEHNLESKHYGWKHEFPDEDKLKRAIDIIWEAVKNG